MASTSNQHESPPLPLPLPLQAVEGMNGLTKVVVRERKEKGSSAEVYPYGAHVTSWKTEDGEELLFVSKKATFEPPKPIIGGIPIYFPHASFTMTRKWRMEDNKTLPQEKDKVYFDFILEHKDGEIPHWPHRFSFRQRIALKKGGALELTSCVRNDDTKPFSFSLACPIHLAVSNIDDIRVEGLEDSMEYTNILDENDITFEPPFFDEEVSRIYGGAPSMIKVIDHHRKRTYCIKKEGFPDIVVWNPWDKSKTMIDCCNPCGKEEPENLIALEDDEYKTMLCIGAAAVSPINLQPQDEWRGIQEITMLPTSNPPLTPS